MYELLYDNRITKDFRPIPKDIVSKILRSLSALPTNPRRHGVEKLAGSDGYRLRVQDYRILFRIDDRAKTITVYRIKHRSEAYR